MLNILTNNIKYKSKTSINTNNLIKNKKLFTFTKFKPVNTMNNFSHTNSNNDTNEYKNINSTATHFNKLTINNTKQTNNNYTNNNNNNDKDNSVDKLSVWSGYFKKSINDRRSILESELQLNCHSLELLNSGGIDISIANHMIENCVGLLSLPLGLGLNFIINNKLYSIPMATEEPSIIAAASAAAKFIAENSLNHSFITSSTNNIMIGQIQLSNCANIDAIRDSINKNKQLLIQSGNLYCQSMVKRGGGIVDIKLIHRPNRINNNNNSTINSSNNNNSIGSTCVVYIYVDVCESMGANMINTICEGLSSTILNYVHSSDNTNINARLGLRILTNLCLERRARSEFRIPVNKLGWKGVSGVEVCNKLIEAYNFACCDEFRACTNNKGIMNGIDSVAIACGQDYRAIESSAHTFAWKQNTKQFINDYNSDCYSNNEGIYGPLAHYKIEYNKDNPIDLENAIFVGYLELPISVGVVGGSITSHPLYKLSLQILQSPNTKQLAEIMVSVGLAQNFAAMRALAIEGIQKGHMALHAKNIVISTQLIHNNNQYLITETADYLTNIQRINKLSANHYINQRLIFNNSNSIAPSTFYMEITYDTVNNKSLTILLLFQSINCNSIRFSLTHDNHKPNPIQTQLFNDKHDIYELLKQEINNQINITHNNNLDENELMNNCYNKLFELISNKLLTMDKQLVEPIYNKLINNNNSKINIDEADINNISNQNMIIAIGLSFLNSLIQHANQYKTILSKLIS